MIGIVDYGLGNVRSVARALASQGARPQLTANYDELARSEGIVLPGVGAFAAALRNLESGNLGRGLVELARKGKPLLGVCLGYQLLFEQSAEHGRHQGLGLLRGEVVEVSRAERLPVTGWCRLRQLEWSPLLAGVADDSYFYFVHSYTPEASPDAVAAAHHTRAAAAGRLNVQGTQFHPEKSGAKGLQIYANFLAMCGGG